MNIRASLLIKILLIHTIALPVALNASSSVQKVLSPQKNLKIYNTESSYVIASINSASKVDPQKGNAINFATIKVPEVSQKQQSDKAEKVVVFDKNKKQGRETKKTLGQLKIIDDTNTKAKANIKRSTSKLATVVKSNSKNKVSVKNSSVKTIKKTANKLNDVNKANSHNAEFQLLKVNSKVTVPENKQAKVTKVSSRQPDLSYINNLVNKKSVSKGFSITTVEQDLKKAKRATNNTSENKLKTNRVKNKTNPKNISVSLPTDYIQKNEKAIKQQLENTKLKEKILLLKVELEQAKRELTDYTH